MARTAFATVLCIVLAAVVATAVATAEETKLNAEQMKAVLGTATPEENGFINRVVTMVEQGQLPASLVESTLLWARRKPDHRFQYFKRGLILRAAKEGIRI